MAAIACDPGVFAVKRITSLFVIEILDVPFDQREFSSIVIRMAACACLARTCCHPVGGMQPAPRCQVSGNLCMTIQAFENSFPAAEFMTASTLGSAVQSLVRSRERTRGNLSLGISEYK